MPPPSFCILLDNFHSSSFKFYFCLFNSIPLCPLAFFFASRHHSPMGFSTTHHHPLFEERNIFFLPNPTPHVALPFLTIPHWLSLSIVSFSLFLGILLILMPSFPLFHHHPQYSSLLFQLHGHHFCRPIIICYHHSNYPIIVPTISYCSHHPITLSLSCCFDHPIVSLINPCCHPYHYSLFSMSCLQLYHFSVFPSSFKPNWNVP